MKKEKWQVFLIGILCFVTAASICANNFIIALTPLTSSIKHVIPSIIIPIKNPISFK